MSNKPNEVALLIGTKTTGVSELADKVINDAESPEKKLYDQARAIRTSRIQKQYLEACLLCEKDYSVISEILEIPEQLVKMYNDVYYNVNSMNRLEKLEVLETEGAEPKETLLKTWALNQGIQFLAWRLGRTVQINPQEGLNELFSNCMYKSKEALFTGNAAEASKESTKWVKLSLDIARLLKLWQIESMASANKDLEFAIKEVVPEFKSMNELVEINAIIEQELKKAESIGVDIGE